MLFEKLIEQHCVYHLVADRAELALGVMGHQIRVHLRHLFGDETKLRNACLIQFGLVMEGHGTQGQQRLTGIAHVGDVCFESTRREKHPQLTVIVHVTGAAARPDCLSAMPAR